MIYIGNLDDGKKNANWLHNVKTDVKNVKKSRRLLQNQRQPAAKDVTSPAAGMPAS